MGENKVNLIEQRVIEASALVPVIQAFSQKIGSDAAKTIVRQTHEKLSRAYGEECAKEKGSNTLADFAQIVSAWGKGGALEEEIIEFTETTYAFNVTKCMYAERYRELGIEAFGYCLSCCRDEPFAQGFNANIKFERHQTIMEGGSHCDFRFTLTQGD